jgi:hypothetical protein
VSDTRAGRREALSVESIGEFNENPQVLRFNGTPERGKFVYGAALVPTTQCIPPNVFLRMTCTRDRRRGVEEDVPWTFN